ncbi:unnamed protein product, partial [Ectocarpus sp. 12 AP-2014]
LPPPRFLLRGVDVPGRAGGPSLLLLPQPRRVAPLSGPRAAGSAGSGGDSGGTAVPSPRRHRGRRGRENGRLVAAPAAAAGPVDVNFVVRVEDGQPLARLAVEDDNAPARRVRVAQVRDRLRGCGDASPVAPPLLARVP